VVGNVDGGGDGTRTAVVVRPVAVTFGGGKWRVVVLKNGGKMFGIK
jgi:hypothetical protein